MKKLYLFFALFLCSMPVSAQYRESHDLLEHLEWNADKLNIMVDARFDFQATINNVFPPSGYTGVPVRNKDYNTAQFKANTIRILLLGDIAPGVHYRIRQRLNGDYSGKGPDGFLSATDHAWIGLDFGGQKNWTATIGKQSFQFGTFEYDYNGADIYMGTLAVANLPSYATGLNIAYKFLGQRVNLQVTNSPFASTDFRYKAFAGSVLWEGSLWKDIIKTRWAFSTLQYDNKKWYNWMTLGTQLNIRKFTTELDYYYRTRAVAFTDDEENEVIGNVREQSLALNLKFALGKWHPSVKGTWNNRYDKSTAGDIENSWGLEGVVEFYPFSRQVKDLRFHLAYTYGKTGYLGRLNSTFDQNTNTIILGMRWLFKVK